MSNEEFLIKAKNWINHKIILSQKSTWYNRQPRKDAICHIKNIFSSFLQYPLQYNVSQLAIQVKRHEELLMAVLPIPQNPTYQNAFNGLSQVLLKATEIIQQNNLQSLINQ